MSKTKTSPDPQLLDVWEAFETYAIPVVTEEVNKPLPDKYFIHIKFIDPQRQPIRRLRIRILEKTNQAYEYWPCVGSTINIIRANNLQDRETNARALYEKAQDLIKRILTFADANKTNK